jgi:hypothetical protein
VKIVPGAALVSSCSVIDPVVDHLADLALWEAELAAHADGVDPFAAASSLLERLRQVPESRRLGGPRHPLLVILVLTACATLVASNDCVTAIRQWRRGPRRMSCTAWEPGVTRSEHRLLRQTDRQVSR